MFTEYRSEVFPHSNIHDFASIYPVWVGFMSAAPNFECGPRILDDFFLIYCSKGKGRFRSEEKRFPFSEGSMFFLFPGVVHWYTTDPEHLIDLWWIGFNGPYAQKMVQAIGLNIGNPVIHNTDDEIPGIVKKIVDETDLQSLPGLMIAAGELYRLLGRCGNSGSNGKKPDALMTYSYSHKIEKALSFLDKNYPNDITINQAAEHSGLSRTHFAVQFKKEVGMSPISYLTKLRIKQAKYLLAMPEYTIKEIAFSVGFHDQFYFSRVFSRLSGSSPRQYRRQMFGENSSSKKISKSDI